jgi:hypothetical protein
MLAVLLLSSAAFAQQGAKKAAPDSVAAFVAVKGEPEYEPQSFKFSESDYEYTISSNGRGKRSGGGTSARNFNLRLNRADSLQFSIYHAEYEGDLLLICQAGDVEMAAGFITRLDGKTLRMKWKLSIRGFNLGPGLIEGNHAYVTAIGFIGKVNLRSGTFAWRHTNLYRNNDFNSFELPEVSENEVMFTEMVTHKEDPAKTITVDKRSGKIISITAAGKS